MIRNYIKVGLRYLARHKAYSIINIAGLAIGLASAIFILLWIKDELSYDRFHQHADDLYRVTCQVEDIQAVISPAPLAAAAKHEFPEVEDALLMTMYETILAEVEDVSYTETQAIFVDSNFLDMFSFELLRGNRSTCFANPHSILLTQQTAQKYFGKDDPIGRVIRIENRDNMIVTGILADIPANSHLQFDLAMPTAAIRPYRRDIRENVWDNFNYYSYLKLKSSITPESIDELETKIESLYHQHESELRVSFHLQPLKKVHLHSSFLGDVPGHGEIQYVYLFSLVALLILIAASINFMNLSTARASRRAREVGFRKVAGAIRSQLVSQFLTESCLITFTALIFAVILVFALLPLFNQLTAKQIYLMDIDTNFGLGLLALTFILGLFAGSYPAFYLSRFKPVKVLSLSRYAKSGPSYLRNTLVIIQFTISIVLIIGTIVVYQQRQFIKTRNLGFDKENLIYFTLRGELSDHQDQVKSALENNPLTTNYTIVDGLPTDLLSGTIAVDWPGKDPELQVIFAQMDGDASFIKVFGMSLRSGRTFSAQHKSETGRYILNEKALAIMNMDPDSAIGQSFNLWGNVGQIVGVVEDFNFKPISQPIEPMVIRYREQGTYAVVRSHPGRLEETIEAIESIQSSLNPLYPIEYGFIDEDLENLYQSERRLGKLSNIFALLALFISCLGLYGLSAYLAEQRKKEIGIRKVVGASITGLVIRLNREFTTPLWIAMLLAIPLGHFLMQRWLERFAYHIEVKWWIALLACLPALVIAISTVSIETIKAARSNPVDSLQQE